MNKRILSLAAKNAGTISCLFFFLCFTAVADLPIPVRPTSFPLQRPQVVGKVVAWGLGQTAPNSLTGVVQVAAGFSHTVALKSDGTVVAWGNNGNGQTSVPTGLSGVVQVAAGGSHTVALKSDGTVVAWGFNGYGQTTIPSGLSGVVQVAAGGSHTVALKSDGTVVAWGFNFSGQTTVPADLIDVVQVTAGDSATVALKSDGTVVAWGSGISWGAPTESGFVQVAAVSNNAVALKSDGTIVAWGNGQSSVPSGLSGVVQVAAGYYHAVALKSDGTVVAWGYNWYGETTVPAGLTNVVQVAAGYSFTLALSIAPTITSSNWINWIVGGASNQSLAVESGTAPFTWQVVSGTLPSGMNLGSDGKFSGSPGASGFSSFTVKVTDANGKTDTKTMTLQAISTTATGGGHAFTNLPIPTRPGTFPLSRPQVVRKVVGWGNNANRQATIPSGLTGVVQVAPGGYHVAALKNDGTVVAWGDNFWGQTAIPSSLTGVVQVAAGILHTVALKDDGTLVAWGNNVHGQSTIPGGLTDVVQVAAGGYYTVALKSDGTVVAWGNNSNGQTTVPAGLTDVVQVAAGIFHTVALKSDGTVVAWGNNGNGQTSVPGGLTGVVQIAAGGYHTVALKSDGSLVAWGNCSYGQSSVPVTLSEVVQVAAGDWHTVAIKSDGTVAAWGSNSYSQSTIPAGLIGVAQVSARASHTVALEYVLPTISSTRLSRLVSDGGTQQLNADGGTSPLTWTIVSGSLPAGLSLGSDGTISGAPAAFGIFTFNAKVTDANGWSNTTPVTFRSIPDSTTGGGTTFFNLAGAPGNFTGSADGTGNGAAFSSPSGIAVDPSGNVYVSDAANNIIRKVTFSGTVTTVAGSFSGSADGTGTAAQLSNPQGIALDPAGNLYVAEYSSHRIRKITAAGSVAAFSGSAGFSGSADGSGIAARFNQPADVAVDSSGNVYVADSGNHAIRKIAANGTVVTLAGAMGAPGSADGTGASARFSSPQGVAVDAAGNVFVADTANCLIRRVTSNGTVSTFAGAAFTGSADGPGRANFSGSADFSGQPSVDGTGTGASFSFPTDVAVDSSGNLFVTDSGTGKIRKITSGGVVTTLGGTPDGFFCNPVGVAADATSGNLYVADAGNNRIAAGMSARVIGVSGNLAFGSVTVNAIKTATMTISNTGNAALTVRGITYPPGFSGNWSSGTIAAGGNQNVTVTFSPTAAQAYSGNVTVASDSISGSGTISASGQGSVAATPYATWQESKFSAAEIAAGSAAMTVDFDKDGMSNLAEYALGGDPKVPDSASIAPKLGTKGNQLQISYHCDDANTDISYIVQAASDLVSWTDIAKSTGGATAQPVGSLSTVSDTGTGARTVTVTDSLPAGGKRFLRLKIVSPAL